MKKELTQERLKELLDYNPETGVFTWKAKSAPAASKVKIGDVAGSFETKGYKRIKINYKQYKSHRLAWLYVNGRWPAEELDHIDGNPGNNSISNLRECSRAENTENRAPQGKHSSGLIGVSWNERKQKWKAVIAKDRKSIFLGYFHCKYEAHKEYQQAKRQLHQFNPELRAA